MLLSLADYRGYASPDAFVEAVWRQRVGSGDLERQLRVGGLFLLCDALNEMPFSDPAEYRERIGAWCRFVQAWPGNRLVFTCRSRDYGEPMGLPQVEIERLDDQRVQDFLGRYLTRDLAADAWGRLDSSPLLDLVRNPYYLYILCWLVAQGEAWPGGRADLFRGFVGHLLDRERRKGHPDWPGEAVLSAVLAELAQRMQRLGEGMRLPRVRGPAMSAGDGGGARRSGGHGPKGAVAPRPGGDPARHGAGPRRRRTDPLLPPPAPGVLCCPRPSGCLRAWRGPGGARA